MEIRWNELKSKRLKHTRGVSFEEILKEEWIATRPHPKKAGQELFLFERRGYIWVVPFVRDEKGIFLKTLFPHRRFTVKECPAPWGGVSLQSIHAGSMPRVNVVYPPQSAGGSNSLCKLRSATLQAHLTKLYKEGELL